MRELEKLTNQIMQKVSKNLDSIIKEELKKFNPNSILNELGYSRSEYENRVAGCAGMFYYHLIFVYVLGPELPGSLPHWKEELMTIVKKIIEPKFKQSAKKTKRSLIIDNEMMRPLMGINFEDYGPEDIESALNYEYKKLSRESKKEHNQKTLKWYKISMDFIKKMIPHAEDLAPLIRPKIEEAYAKLKKCADNNELDEMLNYIEEMNL